MGKSLKIQEEFLKFGKYWEGRPGAVAGLGCAITNKNSEKDLKRDKNDLLS